MDDYDQGYFETARRIAPPDGARWWVERTGRRSYLGHNGRGATVLMADTDDALPGSFTPGELLKLALAGCSGMTCDRNAARRLGDDFAATIVVESATHETDDRYTGFTTRVLLDTATLDEGARDSLVATLTRAIAKGCTVGLTLKNGASVDLRVEDAPTA